MPRRSRQNPPLVPALPELVVICRHLGGKAPPNSVPGWRWQVEVHEGRGFPSGLAWVTAPPPEMADQPAGWDARAQIEFILVADDSRRRGIATRLVEACRQRWPGAELSLPISPAGAALYRKVSPRVAPEDVFNKEFIANQLAAGATPSDLERMAVEHHQAMTAVGASEEAPRARPNAAGKKPQRRSSRAGKGKATPN